MTVVKLTRAKHPKKWQVTFPDGKVVRFGAKGYSDYTLHKDKERMKRYIQRHSRMGETWTKKGIRTPGFWARWLLWSKPSLEGAKKLIQSKFNLSFK